jgi:DinB family protein
VGGDHDNDPSLSEGGVEMTELATKNDLLATLKDSNRRAAAWFQGIAVNNFFERDGDVWSPSDNLDHMIKAVKPITKALKLPKITLHVMFGKPDKVSVSYEELCKLYRDVLASGGQASGRYLPNQQSPKEDTEKCKSNLLQQWSDAGEELVSAADKWREDDLDRYQLPHPLLGKLTVREMLYFTIYHNLRHASLEGD